MLMRSFIIIGLLLLTFTGATAAQPIVGEARVTDGDTLCVNGVKIRLEGMDAPELNRGQRCKRNGNRYNCGKDSRAALMNLWTRTEIDPDDLYVDFKSRPHLIRSTIGDLKPYHYQPFAEEFLSLLTWLNSGAVSFESNDCAFRGPQPNIDSHFKNRLRTDGRLMILYRQLLANTQPASIDWLQGALFSELQKIEPDFWFGAVGLSKMATVYMDLHPDPKKGALGQQIMISMFAYGNNSRKCLDNMRTVLRALRHALAVVDCRLKSGQHVPDILDLQK
jgi:hypothetical protein